MLYIWPLFAFFSVPIVSSVGFFLFDTVLGCASSSSVQAVTSTTNRPRSPQSRTTGTDTGSQAVFKRAKGAKDSPQQLSAFDSSEHTPGRTSGQSTLRLLLCAALATFCVIGALVVIKYNTIIHPFTLADNRHYMFYIFRYTIRRPGLFRYYLIFPYLISALLAYKVLTIGDDSTSHPVSAFNNHPYDPRSGLLGLSETNKASPKGPEKSAAASEISTLEEDDASQSTVPTSTAILLLLSTALSLVTAPLVEPRYFIIPWIMWRLLVPAWSTKKYVNAPRHIPVLGLLAKAGSQFDLRLPLETAWFVAINVATIAVFLLMPYQWRTEDGTLLDEGRLQRFMW